MTDQQTLDMDARNAETSTQEVAAFIADPPERYFAYRPASDMAHITTWTGDLLANVISAGTPFRSNFGDLRQNFRARGINEATYSGTSYLSSGDYVRMHKLT